MLNVFTDITITKNHSWYKIRKHETGGVNCYASTNVQGIKTVEEVIKSITDGLPKNSYKIIFC